MLYEFLRSFRFTLLFLAILILVTLFACEKPAVSSERVAAFEVEKLFTHEGCTAYRFMDNGYNRYYVVCGRDVTTQSRIPEGKNDSRPDSIPTVFR